MVEKNALAVKRALAVAAAVKELEATDAEPKTAHICDLYLYTRTRHDMHGHRTRRDD